MLLLIAGLLYVELHKPHDGLNEIWEHAIQNSRLLQVLVQDHGHPIDNRSRLTLIRNFTLEIGAEFLLHFAHKYFVSVGGNLKGFGGIEDEVVGVL